MDPPYENTCNGRRARLGIAQRGGFLRRIAPLVLCGTAFCLPGHIKAATENIESLEAPGDLDRPPPGRERSIRPIRVRTPPEIDGRLGDAAWIEAQASSGFWVTTQERWPAEPTDVMVVVDDERLYVAIRAWDSVPEQILALETVRDRKMGNDDQVKVEIDAFGDHEGVSRFSVNALGTQEGNIAGGRASNSSWKGLWYAAANRTDYGWVAELAIPFEILNYRPGTDELAINFSRYQNRAREWSQWADVTPQDKKEEMGRLVGLQLPTREEVHQTWTLMPYGLAGSNVPDRSGEVQDSLVTGGIDLRYTPSSNLTHVLSLNPDFSQLEKQFADANFAYNEKALVDPRVFFVEGKDYLGADERVFYSPRVPDFDAGAKVFGQSGTIRYAGFVSSAPDSRRDELARMAIAPDATHNGSLSFVGTDRAGGHGSTVALGYEGREDFGGVFEGHYIETDNDFLDSGRQKGSMFDVSAAWRGDYLQAGTDYDEYDKTFNPANGLIKSDRLGTNGQSVFANYFRDYGSETISQVSMDFNRSYRETDDGRSQNDNWYVGGNVELRQFVRTSVEYSDGYYRPGLDDAPGYFGDTVHHDRYWSASVDLNTRGSRIGGGASVASGKLGGGDYDYVTSYLWTRPTPTTIVNVVAERLDSFGTYRQYVVEAGWDINQSNSLIFRHVLYDGYDYWRLGYSRRLVSRGLDVFTLYDRSPETGEQISVKVLWALSPNRGGGRFR